MHAAAAAAIASPSDTERHHNPRAQLLLMERFGELASKLGYDLSAEQIAKVADVVTKPPADPMQAMVSSEHSLLQSAPAVQSRAGSLLSVGPAVSVVDTVYSARPAGSSGSSPAQSNQ